MAAKARYSADCRRYLDDCASANAWWRTLKGHVFGAESDIPPLCSPGGALVSDPAGKAELLSTWFDSNRAGQYLNTLYLNTVFKYIYCI